MPQGVIATGRHSVPHAAQGAIGCQRAPHSVRILAYPYACRRHFLSAQVVLEATAGKGVDLVMADGASSSEGDENFQARPRHPSHGTFQAHPRHPSHGTFESIPDHRLF